MFSLKKFNANMKQKPKEVRALYAFWFAAAATGVMGLIWLVTIPSTLDRIANKNSDEERPSGNFVQVLQSMRANVSDSVASFRDIQTETSELFNDGTAPTGESSVTTNTINFADFFNEGMNDEAEEWIDEDEWLYDEDEIESEALTEETLNGASEYAQVSEPTPSIQPREPRQVLIGTTTARTSTSSSSE